MIRTKRMTRSEASQREALRRRVKQMYDCFNRELWVKCMSLVDPRLKDQSAVKPSVYAKQLEGFKKVYGSIRPWHIRVSLHLGTSSNKNDPRPFAYVYVVWQDASHGFHMFKERWIKDSGRWYTRVAGLVANRQSSKD